MEEPRSSVLSKRSESISHDESAESSKEHDSSSRSTPVPLKKDIDYSNGFDQSQICASLLSTVSTMSTMLASANSVRAAACEGENKYVTRENSKIMIMDTHIKEEDIACTEKLNEIKNKWKTFETNKGPQELSHQISDVCKECDTLIKSKNDLIDVIRGEMKAVDEDYQRMFRQQTKDVNFLISSMGCQVLDFHNTQVDELCKIEGNLVEQRKDLLMRNKSEIDALLKKVRATECRLKAEIIKKMEGYSKALDNIRTVDMEDYNLLKVRLETDIQTLEQHLESMAAAYQLNTEKLDYNYAVLVERDHDNYVTAGQQKRKLTKQRDTLSTLKTRHNDLEKRFLLQNGKLAIDYEKVIKLLQDLQGKEHHLQAAQEKQHWEFLHMHQNLLAVLASKLLQADKRIHEEHLGWVWTPPCMDIFTSLGTYISSNLKAQYHHGHGSETNDDYPKVKQVKPPSITEVEKVWGCYNGLISPKVLHVWTAFAAALMDYNRLLQNRTKLMHDVYTLQQEKKFLQGAVAYCMTTKGK